MTTAVQKRSLFDTPRAWWACFVLLILALLLPLLVTDFPPLFDYPNHLARIFFLAHADDPVLSRFYEARWTLIPNLAIDIMGPALLKVLPVYAAGRILIALAVLLPVIGVIAYARAISGVRSYWPFAAGLLGYNAILLLGFLNFQMSLGLAFIAAALWHQGRAWPLWLSALIVSGLAVVIFFTHISGLVFLGMLMAGTEIASGPHTGRIPRLTAAAAVFVLPVALYSVSGISAEAGASVWDWPAKRVFQRAFMAYDSSLDSATAVAVLTFLYVALVTRSAKLSRPAGVALILGIAAYIALPKMMKNAAFVDVRFLVFVSLMLFAVLAPQKPVSVIALSAAAVFGGLFLTRLVMLTIAWREHDSDVAEFRNAIAAVEPGSSVLLASAANDSGLSSWKDLWRGRGYAGFYEPADTHLGGLLVIERRAFWPGLFARPSQQPVVVRPPYSEISFVPVELPSYRFLENADAAAVREYPPLQDWKQRFDMVVVMGADKMPSTFLPQELAPVRGSCSVALYRVKHPGSEN